MKILVTGGAGYFSRSVDDVPAIADSAIQFFVDAGEARAFAIQNTWGARFDAAKLLA